MLLSTAQTHPYYVVAGLVALYAVFRFKNAGRREKGLPPGPPTLPVIGNLHIMPMEYTHLQFTKWSKKYGEIFSLKVADGTAIVVTSIEAARELLDRRSAVTVDRPKSLVSEIVTGGKNIVLSGYTEDWRALRRTAHTILTPQASAEHVAIQLAESCQLLYDMLHDPENFYTHIRREASSIILSVLYGRRAPRFATQEVTDFFHAQDLWTRLLDPGAVPPVDLFPILAMLPERWAPWKRDCREVRRRQRELYFGLLGECEDRLRVGKHVRSTCFMEEVIERREQLGLTRELAGYLGGALIEGGSDTTSASSGTCCKPRGAAQRPATVSNEVKPRVLACVSAHSPSVSRPKSGTRGVIQVLLIYRHFDSCVSAIYSLLFPAPRCMSFMPARPPAPQTAPHSSIRASRPSI